MENLEQDYLTIANNVPKVYEAGWKKVLNNAESLKGTLSGKAVSANDVIDIEHNIPCQLTSDTVTDFSSVKVSRYGKNLLNQELFATNKWFTKQSDGSYKARIKYVQAYALDVNLPPAVYNLSAKVKSKSGSNHRISVIYADGDDFSKYYSSTGDWVNMSWKSDGRAIKQIGFYYSTTNGWEEFYFKDYQVELGSSKTDFEEYKKPTTYTVNTDGTVEGITSISPSMTLLTDTEGAVINANYYKDPDIVVTNLLQSIALSGGDE